MQKSSDSSGITSLVEWSILTPISMLQSQILYLAHGSDSQDIVIMYTCKRDRGIREMHQFNKVLILTQKGQPIVGLLNPESHSKQDYPVFD